MNTTNEDLAYLAGLMDGEGSWSIQVNIRNSKGIESVHFNPRMTMTLKYGNEVLDRYVSAFGGRVYSYKDGMRRWSVGERTKLIYATNELLPFLVIKRNIAAQFLTAMSIFPAHRANHAAGERSWTPEMTEQVARIALTLNPGTARKSSKGLEFLNKLDGIYRTENRVDAILKSSEEDDT